VRLVVYCVTALQNGQTRYSTGISLPQLGQALRPAPPGAGGGTAAVGGGGGAAVADGAAAAEDGSGAAPPPRFGGMRPASASSVVSVPAGGAVMPARTVPWPCCRLH